MNILHIIQNMNIGGAQTTLINLISELSMDTHYIITYQIDSVQHRKLSEYNNIKLFVLKSAQEMLDILRKIPFDVVHYHWWPGLTVLNRMFVKMNKPVILTLQEQCAPPVFNDIFYVAGSESNFKYLSNVKDDKKSLIYLGVNREKVVEKSNRDILECKSKTIKIGRVSTIIPTKIPLNIFEVFSQLHINKYNIEFYLYGEGDLQFVESLKRKSENFAHINIIIDTNKNVMDKYSKLDVFLYWLPEGNTESFGLVIVEAMLSKVPIIAQRAGAIPEIINNGYNGFLFDETNEINYYLSLLTNNTTRKRIVENAYNTAVENFTSSIMAQKYRDLYINRIDVCSKE